MWSDSTDDAKIESALTPVPTNNYEGEDVKEERIWLGAWNYRELPYGHDYFIENVSCCRQMKIVYSLVVFDLTWLDADPAMVLYRLWTQPMYL